MHKVFDEIRKGIEQCEALQNYSSVVKENIELKEELGSIRGHFKASQKRVFSLEGLKLQYAGKEVSIKELEVEIQKVYGEEIEKNAQKRFEKESPSLILSELDRQLKLPREKRPQYLNKLLDLEVKRVLFWEHDTEIITATLVKKAEGSN